MPNEPAETDLARLQRRFEELQSEAEALIALMEMARKQEEQQSAAAVKPSGKRLITGFQAEDDTPTPRVRTDEAAD